jgi:uncharacterized membrane protein YjgN (DUF898 family)
MEEQNVFESNEQPQTYTLKFLGNGSEYFGIIIVNWLLTLITLGIYYPWARARKIKYLYGATALNDDRFAFHGEGKEMFRGFVKVILVYASVVGILNLAKYYVKEKQDIIIYLILTLVAWAILLAVLPLIYHGVYRYRMSRTTWRGIRFGYRGTKKQIYINFLKWLGLTIITFGIYACWYKINMRKYLIGNVRGGDVEFSYKGKGEDLFVIYFLGYILTLVSLGIYAFWWEKELWNYYIDNILLHKNDKTIRLKSSVTGGGIFKLRIVNLLLTVFTLGLGYAWVKIRTRKYFTENIHLIGDINLDEIAQTEDIYTNAAFEDAGDFFDIDIDIF